MSKFQDFQGPLHKFQDFPGLDFKFTNSRTCVNPEKPNLFITTKLSSIQGNILYVINNMAGHIYGANY